MLGIPHFVLYNLSIIQFSIEYMWLIILYTTGSLNTVMLHARISTVKLAKLSTNWKVDRSQTWTQIHEILNGVEFLSPPVQRAHLCNLHGGLFCITLRLSV